MSADHILGTPHQKAPHLDWYDRKKIKDFLREKLLLLHSDSDNRVVLFEGPRGIGHSSLLHYGDYLANSLGMRTIASFASSKDSQRPMSTLKRLFPSLPSSHINVDLNCIKSLIDIEPISEGGAEKESPLVILIDNAQFIDDFSISVIEWMSEHGLTRPVLYILSSSERSTYIKLVKLHSNTARNMVDLITIPPMTDSEIFDMCLGLLGAGPGPSLFGLLKKCGSNPKVLDQTIGELQHNCLLSFREGLWELVGNPVPLIHKILVQYATTTLSASYSFLEAATILVQPFSPEEIAGLLDHSTGSMVNMLEDCLFANLIVHDGPLLRFQNDFLRRSVYDAMEMSRRRFFHRRARVLRYSEDLTQGRIIGQKPTACSIDVSSSVSEIVESIQHFGPDGSGHVGELVVRSLGAAEISEEDRCRHIVDTVRHVAQSGRVVEARSIAEAAIARWPSTEENQARVQLALASVFHLSGHARDVLRLTTHILDRSATIPHVLTISERADLLALRAHALLDTSDLLGATSAAHEAGMAAKQAAIPATVVCSLSLRGAASRGTGDIELGIRLGRQAVLLAQQSSDAARQRCPRLWLAETLASGDNLHEALAVLEVGQTEATKIGASWSSPSWYCSKAVILLAVGRLEEAGSCANMGIDEARRLDSGRRLPDLYGLRAIVSLLRGESAAAERSVSEAERLYNSGLSWSLLSPRVLRGIAFLAEGAHESALCALGHLYDDDSHMRELIIRDPYFAIVLAVAAKHPHGDVLDSAALAKVASVTQLLARRNPSVTSIKAAEVFILGLKNNQAEEMAHAARLFQISGRSLNAALSLAYATLLDPEKVTRKQIMNAKSLARQSGAEYIASLFPETCSIASHTAAASAWDLLSAPELRVARMVAEGFTNREVANFLHLSPHTIDSHLRKCYKKLGVHRRVELTRAVFAYDQGAPRC